MQKFLLLGAPPVVGTSALLDYLRKEGVVISEAELIAMDQRLEDQQRAKEMEHQQMWEDLKIHVDAKNGEAGPPRNRAERRADKFGKARPR